MTIAVGDRIPEVDVRVIREGAQAVIPSTEVLGSGRVVLFAVPGAFTPGCHKQHLPGFVTQAAEIAAAALAAARPTRGVVDRLAAALPATDAKGSNGNGGIGGSGTML